MDFYTWIALLKYLVKGGRTKGITIYEIYKSAPGQFLNSREWYAREPKRSDFY